jgi:hypothetical protein
VGVTLYRSGTPSHSPTKSVSNRPENETPAPAEPAADNSQASILQQTQARVSVLEQLVKAREAEADLMRRLDIATSSTRKRQRSDSPEQSSSKVIKVKNIIQFTGKMTFRCRQKWLQDLDRAFQGDPQRFQAVKNRILFSLEHMDANIHSR